jgi:hypothetical protein
MEGLKEKRSVADICREHTISQTLYYRWRDFRYYAIADGIKEIFAKYSGQIFYRRKIPKEFDPQTKLLLY